jgi:hypothetical protein
MLENLSASGVLLVGDTRLAVGDHVRVLIPPGSHGLALEARVVRHARRGEQSVFAVRFEDPSPTARDALQRMIPPPRSAGLAERAVLIVDGARSGLEHLTADLEQLGRHPVIAQTTSAACGWLEAHAASTEAIVVDSAWEEGVGGRSLLEFVTTDYPDIRRVLVCESGVSDAASVLQARHAHALLARPWDRDSLRQALGA